MSERGDLGTNTRKGVAWCSLFSRQEVGTTQDPGNYPQNTISLCTSFIHLSFGMANFRGMFAGRCADCDVSWVDDYECSMPFETRGKVGPRGQDVCR